MSRSATAPLIQETNRLLVELTELQKNSLLELNKITKKTSENADKLTEIKLGTVRVGEEMDRSSYILLGIKDGISSQRIEGTKPIEQSNITITPTIQNNIDSLSNNDYSVLLKNIELINNNIKESLSYALQIDEMFIYNLNKQFPWIYELYKIPILRISEYNSNMTVLGNGGGYNYDQLYLPIPTRTVKIEQKINQQQQKILPENILQGTNNVIFTKLENQQPNSYSEQIGDYTRIDETGLTPCKLRFNPKNADFPFTCSQEYKGKTKINYFNNISEAIKFCCAGGFYADFLMSKQKSLYESQTTKRPRPYYYVSY